MLTSSSGSLFLEHSTFFLQHLLHTTQTFSVLFVTDNTLAITTQRNTKLAFKTADMFVYKFKDPAVSRASASSWDPRKAGLAHVQQISQVLLGSYPQ